MKMKLHGGCADGQKKDWFYVNFPSVKPERKEDSVSAVFKIEANLLDRNIPFIPFSLNPFPFSESSVFLSHRPRETTAVCVDEWDRDSLAGAKHTHRKGDGGSAT